MGVPRIQRNLEVFLLEFKEPLHDQYRILEEGTGPNPKPEDTVRVHYRGTLIDGTEFDSSYKRGTTIDFQVGGVIPGWREGIQLVKEGGKIARFRYERTESKRSK